MIRVGLPNKKDIEHILLDDDIHDRITDDNCPDRGDFQIPFKGCIYIGGYIEGHIASLFIVHNDNKMHFMVIKQHRRHAKELLAASFKMWPHDVYVEIPVLYRSVINFAKNFGFVEMEIKKDDHLKNGKTYDCHKLSYEVNHGIS